MSEQIYDEIVCIGRYEDKAIFLDEYNHLAYVNDENEILVPGDYYESCGTLVSFDSLPKNERQEILKIILKK